MRAVNSIEDARIVIQELQNRLDALETKSVNFHGRRITNAGVSQDDFDYVVKKELEDLKSSSRETITTNITEVISGTFPVTDTTEIIKGSGDPTKQIRFEVDSLTPAVTRVLTVADQDYILAGRNVDNFFTAEQTVGSSRLTSEALEVNVFGSGNRYAYIDLHGDDTYTDYGTRLFRDNTGPDTTSVLSHRGSGGLYLQTEQVAPILFKINGIARWAFETSGHFVPYANNAYDIGNSASAVRNFYHANDTKIFWLDSGGTARSMLWLDGSNDFHVGPQAAVTGDGKVFFYSDGQKLLGLNANFGPSLYSETDFSMFLGQSTKRFAGIKTAAVTAYSKVSSGIQAGIEIQSADEVSFVTLRGALVGGSNYILRFPPAGPAAGQVLEFDASGNASWINSNLLPVIDTTSIVKGSGDPTKLLRFEVDGLTTATTRVLTPQDADYIIAGINISNVFSADQLFNNDIKLIWKDTSAANVPMLWMDGLNDFHVGPQSAVSGDGKVFFYSDGQKLLGLNANFGPSLYSETDFLMFLGQSTKRFAGLFTAGVTAYSKVSQAVIATLAIQSADEVSFVNLRGATVGGSNYILRFPSASPAAAGQLLQSDTSGNLSWNEDLYVANTTGDANNTFRIDGFADGLYIVAKSAPGAATGAFIVFRTASAGGGETDRWMIDLNGHFIPQNSNAHDIGGTGSGIRNLYISNDAKVFWFDSGGLAKSMLWLDGSNNFNVGPQADPTPGGKLILWVNGSARWESASGDLYPLAALNLGTISNRIFSVLTTNLDITGQISAASAGAAFPIKGSTSVNGNLLLQPGNVAGNSSVYIEAPRLDQPGLVIVDANGTTTSSGIELRKNDGTVYFKVIGGSGAGAPGVVVSRTMVSFANLTYDIGASVNRWLTGYFQDVDASNSLKIGGNQVVGARQAAVATASDLATCISSLNDLIAKCQTHGLIS